jgi:RNA polymerase sigma factor (sigma-70 family)
MRVDMSSVRALIDRHERALLLYALRLLGDGDRAQDAVQETFFRLVRERPASIGLRTWLFTVCRNVAFDLLRKERRLVALDPDDPVPSPVMIPSELLETLEAEATVLRFVAELPSKEAEALRLKFQGGLTYREIAEVMQLSPGYVGLLIHQGLTTLRVRLHAPVHTKAQGAKR